MSTFGATDEILLRGVGAARDGDRAGARFYLEWALRDDPSTAQFAEAWYWLSRIADDEAAQRHALGQVLGAEPLHAEARRDLAILDGRLSREAMIDPDAPLEPLTPDPIVAAGAIRRYPCPTCGGAMLFDAERRELHCQFCGYRGAAGSVASGVASELGVREQDWEAAIYTARGHRWVLPGERILTCASCGASQTLTEGEISVSCAFCGSAQVVAEGARDDLIAPGGIAPFAFGRDEARRRALGWLGQHHGDTTSLATLTPVYLPYWTFDIEGEVHWQGYVEHRNARERREGTEHTFHDDVLVSAGGALSGGLLATLSFDLGAVVAYSPDILAGWTAEIYRVPVSDASLVARERTLKRERERIYLAATEELHELVVSSVGLAVLSYKLVLLPVWMATYRTSTKKQLRYTFSGQDTPENADEERRNPIGRFVAWMTGDEGGQT